MPHASAGEASASSVPPRRLAGVRVLVVDDEADTRDLFVWALMKRGAHVDAAASAAEAFEVLTRTPPDVLVSDISMPMEDGYSLLRRVRALSHLEGGRVPAIAVTAFAAPEDVERASEAGFDAHLAKPVPIDQLVAALTDLVRR